MWKESCNLYHLFVSKIDIDLQRCTDCESFEILQFLIAKNLEYIPDYCKLFYLFAFWLLWIQFDTSLLSLFLIWFIQREWTECKGGTSAEGWSSWIQPGHLAKMYCLRRVDKVCMLYLGHHLKFIPEMMYHTGSCTIIGRLFKREKTDEWNLWLLTSSLKVIKFLSMPEK